MSGLERNLSPDYHLKTITNLLLLFYFRDAMKTNNSGLKPSQNTLNITS